MGLRLSERQQANSVTVTWTESSHHCFGIPWADAASALLSPSMMDTDSETSYTSSMQTAERPNNLQWSTTCNSSKGHNGYSYGESDELNQGPSLLQRCPQLHNLNTDTGRSVYYFFAIYIHSNEIHNVVALIRCLLILRCQLYMFRTVTVRNM